MEKQNGKKFFTIMAIAIIAMLSFGIPMAQYTQVNVIKDTQTCRDCEILFDGEDDEYCDIASGAQYIIDGIQSGEFTFTELQGYFDGLYGGNGESSVYDSHQYSFDALPYAEIKRTDDIASDSPVEEIRDDDYLPTIDVCTVLLDRLSEATIYCEEPEGDTPGDWQFHPSALCMAAAMTPLVGATIANGVVSAFFALFGPLAWATGMGQWLMLLRGAGIIDAQVLQLSESIYNTCMGLLGGGGGQTG